MGPAGEPAQPRERPGDGWQAPQPAPQPPDFRVILHDLLDLDAADALPGVAPVVTERARQVREGAPGGSLRVMIELAADQAAYGQGGTDDIVRAAAALAALIELQGGAVSGVPTWWPRLGHGTEARYRRHYRAGEKPCEACRLAGTAARAARGWPYRPGSRRRLRRAGAVS
jgi:hypothetical protein